MTFAEDDLATREADEAKIDAALDHECDTRVFTAIVEYSSESGETPTLVIARDNDKLWSGLLDILQGLNYEGTDAEDWVKENPVEDVTLATVGEWYEGLHESATSPWITIHDETDVSDLGSRGVVLLFG
jgi:endo-1,4-beta-mannosidase